MFLHNLGKIFKASITNPNRTTIFYRDNIENIKPSSDEAFMVNEEDRADDSIEQRQGRVTFSDKNRSDRIVVTPQYKAVFNFVATATTLCFVVAVILTFLPNPTEQQKTLITYCLEIFKLGFSASIGLLSGKSLS